MEYGSQYVWFYVPGTEGVNAFAFDWLGEENWLVPPISCVSKVLAHVSLTKSNAVLVTPAWKSAVFWPKHFPLSGKLFPGLVRAFTGQERGSSVEVHRKALFSPANSVGRCWLHVLCCVKTESSRFQPSSGSLLFCSTLVF